MKLKISPFFFIVWIAALVFGKTDTILHLFLCAAFHEAAHLCAFYAFGANVGTLEILPFGISAKLSGAANMSHNQEIFAFLAGPLANLVAAGFCLLAQWLVSGNIDLYGLDIMLVCNLAFAIINLYPVYPLDGGRVIYCLLEKHLSLKKAETISLIISYIFLVPLLIFGIMLIIYTGFNFSLLMIFGYLLLYLLIKGFN